MGIITTGSFPASLVPLAVKWFGDARAAYKPEYVDLFDVEKSTRAYDEEVGVMGFGLASETGQGEGVIYDTSSQSYTSRYTHKKYTKGYIVTEEAIDDNQYDISVLGKREAQALAFAMNQTLETLAANVYNRAFTSTVTFGDGEELCMSAHPLFGGGTFSNVLSITSDLSEAALEQACIDIAGFVDDRGMKIAVLPKSLIVSKENAFEAHRILKSILQSDTNYNNANALKDMGAIPGGVKVNHYLTDADAYFIRTNCPDGMKMKERKALTFGADNDFDTANAKFKASFRVSFGVTDPRGILGSSGA
jgi:hypothetical protein